MAQFSNLFSFILLALVSTVVGAPHARRQGTCTTTEIRKEWRSMTTTERIAYTDAVKCLNDLPTANPLSGAVSRFDNFALSHVQMTPTVHFVGQFLPWHRYFVKLFTDVLRDECDYTGPGPYWNWVIDGTATTPFGDSEIFDPVHGFGGNGVPNTYTLPADPNNELEIPEFPSNPEPAELWNGCVQDGPFKDTDFRLNIGPGRMFTDHCIVRTFNPTNWTGHIQQSMVDDAMAATTYADHWPLVFTGPHLGGHAIIGGVMSNGFSTPGDPLFYPHHAAVDKLWWDWQQVNPTVRLSEISGPTLPEGTVDVTLNYVLEYPGIASSVRIEDVMDISVPPLCYTYV